MDTVCLPCIYLSLIHIMSMTTTTQTHTMSHNMTLTSITHNSLTTCRTLHLSTAQQDSSSQHTLRYSVYLLPSLLGATAQCLSSLSLISLPAAPAQCHPKDTGAGAGAAAVVLQQLMLVLT